MGVIESHHHPGSIFPEQSHEINQSDFQVIPNYSYTHQMEMYDNSNFVILSHKQKPQIQIQKYELFFNTYEQYRAYEKVYQWRNRSKYLVQGRAIKQRANNNMCGNFHQATLFVERIPIRACEVTDVPIQEGLYMLYTCFMGFRKVYERTGYFQISLDMICINKDAQVKIWLNNNLSKIYPQFFTLDQNFTQADFIFRLLSVCEPLVDFSPISQKFSDFLKKCNLDNRQSPQKQTDSRFCKYSKPKDSSVYKNKKQLQSNLRYLSFDKIIEYFERYLDKHKLVVAREMKTIKDLFKYQKKIQHKDPMSSPKKRVVLEKKQSKDLGIEQIEMLPIGQESGKKKTDTKRTNIKPIQKKITTERSNMIYQEALLLQRSQECVTKINSLKEPQLAANRQPSVSFGYKPIDTTRNNLNTTRNIYPSVYSPQHVAENKPFYMHARDRIKTVFSPNFSFFIKPRSAQIEYSLSPNHSYKSTQNKFFKKEKNEVNFDEEMKKMKEQSLRRQSFSGKSEGLQGNTELKVIKEKNQKDSDTKGQRKRSTLQKIDEEKKRKVYYDVEKEVSIDEEIALDLDKFEFFKEQ